ncbi:hypothetical protein COCC4DRAFT_71647 [Bipolaris maydis ATCC 48331]|uniref:Uncharacterized protein n=2 Tax=Cochliobolus heterostrophus TaxID=5016 RepID=M2UB66_COCH5|nr:uncharacterized protein COCC4DRAFT_71647 [Bipolaris maydis ATCC 48331]EMD90936.1 hypothetical protein COCHEDRAFT_1176537 [Bipolaris maydis C5]KAJ5064651.1 hypothetical protein J3E74DRAFT_263460 [Bipolaris maydis]ENI05981.1 hypothetical protein COCC4DRAFT_71647 [Bipolaris maydis ATCC 48331]KAJ6205264.1 hypothetical protein PSV09DRAFT_1176537 [Bipolaris maydis]KAJ6267923.1 hypothetical protein PSV08DRAFT_207900 [Bipolaris maydis]
MQNYGQAPGYQQPGSATGFAGQQSAPPPVPPPPPGYGASQGYQSVAPQPHGQWIPSTPTPTQTSSPWSQSQPQTMVGYNPGTYGAISGAQRQSYAQQQDVPPPPPPKPYGFAAAMQRQEQQQQQQQQNWAQQPQQHANFTPQPQQGGYTNPGPPQPTYPYVAPPPPHAGRPSSIYGAIQTPSTPNAPPVASQQAHANIIPNEQQPAYAPPSMHGTSVQEYMSPNANLTNSIHGPLPSNAPTWQQAQQQPLQGDTSQFTYTRPAADQNPYVQGNQSTQPSYQAGQPPPLPPRVGQQTGQAVQNQQPQYHHYGHQAQTQYPPQTQTPQSYQGQAVPASQQQQQSFAQTQHPQSQHQQQQQPQPPTYGQTSHDQQASSFPQQTQPQNQWQPPPPPDPAYNHHVAQPSYETPQIPQPAQAPNLNQQYPHVQNQPAQESTSSSQTNPVSSSPYESRPNSQPVSPISNRPSLSYPPGQNPRYSRADSINSVAFAKYCAQRAENKTASPKPTLQKFSTPPPPRDDKSTFSALAAGGPSDWEHLGGSEEIDDEDLFRTKPERKGTEISQPDSIELPAHVPSPPSTHGFPSPAVYPTHPGSSDSVDRYMPTPPSVVAHPSERRSPSSTPEGFVVEDAIVAPLRTTPKPTESTRHPRDRFLHEAHSNGMASPAGPGYAAELKAKDELIDQLRAELQQQTDQRRTESEMFKAEREKFESEFEAANSHAADERDVLLAQLESMRLTADQASANSEAVVKEKGLTIDRLKEDMEGKENNLEERDNTIAELRRQLEDEKTKELPKPAAADLIPDLDPWYVGSLERYIAMLRSEAMEPQVQEKMKIFKTFVKAEAGFRGISLFDALPQVPTVEPAASIQPERDSEPHSNSNSFNARRDLKVQVLPDTAQHDDYDYSPGGRPIISRKPTLPLMDIPQMQPQTAPSVQSTTILTPTSSIDDDMNKTPIQSHPEEPSQSQYKAYVPPIRNPEDPPPLRHRQTMSFMNVPSGVSSSGLHKGHDEIFFGAGEPNTHANNPPHGESDDSIPPLNIKSQGQTSVTPPHENDPNKYLARLLPRQLEGGPSRQIQKLRAKLSDVANGLVKMEELMGTWEKTTSLNRRKNDDARRKRQEENEEHNDDLFNNDEISYAEMKQLEEEFKKKEVELKTQEVQEEYKSYMETVFNPVYNGLQAEIRQLMNLYDEAQHLLQTSVSGIKSLEGGDPPSTEDCLEFLEEIYKQAEKRHEGIVRIVAERDRLYKKTEVQPLYAAGKISAMKDLEKHFEAAEKQAVLNAEREKERRISHLVSFVEDFVVDALSTEHNEIDNILAAIKRLDDSTGNADTLSHAHSALEALKHSSKALLSLFNDLEIELNSAAADAAIAQAESDKSGAARVRELQAEKKEAEKKLVDEYTRRVGVLESDEGAIKELVERKTLKEKKGNGDGGKEERLRMALEEAKRRNGHA